MEKITIINAQGALTLEAKKEDLRTIGLLPNTPPGFCCTFIPGSYTGPVPIHNSCNTCKKITLSWEGGAYRQEVTIQGNQTVWVSPFPGYGSIVDEQPC
jgi:hypothetical protein